MPRKCAASASAYSQSSGARACGGRCRARFAHFLGSDDGAGGAGGQVDAGGMPSSHSALCMGLTTAVAMQHGLSSSMFPVSLGFSLIVMYDAAGVRRHAGKQAEVGFGSTFPPPCVPRDWCKAIL